MNGYHLGTLERELEEMKKDLTAFVKAYNAITQRVLESNESEVARRPLLHEWSGSRAVVGSLELSIHAMERTIHEVTAVIQGIHAGEIENLDKPGQPSLGVVDGGKAG